MTHRCASCTHRLPALGWCHIAGQQVRTDREACADWGGGRRRVSTGQMRIPLEEVTPPAPDARTTDC